MPESMILKSQSGAVRTLVLNRPAALNSFNGEMHSLLRAELESAAADVGVRCVLLTGAGRAFCAGQDLADPLVCPDTSQPKDLGVAIERYYAPLVRRLRSMPVPVVVAVNGVAAGAGANLAFCGDLVLAARSASFIQAFGKIGLIPDSGGTWLLPRLVGRARALGLALLGDKLPADEAERMGLIWRSVDDAELLPLAQALAERLAGMPTKALVATRRAMDEAQHLDLTHALTAEAKLQRELGFAHDYQEGVAAFGARRAPVFTDR
ncbi:enoyl-CoA hydratase-related protein [Azohydromonas lata]|uniref:Enoyl-CoA hydratase-related protein n=1 Tax=Azohydromonas lata TaxID=45677 RepID=A0ABU5IAB9_9BURK|nr:enoyl-CoA hydratase-related protein [Azohydromonas lata]MDZ5456047.1 enoyl-CoA hydratase-related protein [Azohydromonas lata]